MSGVIDIHQSERPESSTLELESGVWRWNPNWNVSEEHWLKCGVVIPENARCDVCGKRAIDG